MRRVVGLVLLGLFGFLLVLGLFAQFFLPGAAKKTPLDVNILQTLSGTGSYLGSEAGPVSAWQRTTNAPGSTSDVVVMQNFTCVTKDLGNRPFESPDCPPVGDPRLIDASPDKFATDRTTAMAVAGTTLLGPAGIGHDGLVNKFPFDVEKKTYPFWDTVLLRAVDAEFQGVESVNGLTTYKFHILLENESAEIAKDTPGTYSDDKTMWVDQVTGAIIDQSEDQVRALENGDIALDLKGLAFTDETVKQNVDDAKANGSKLAIVGLLPWVSYALAALALVGGIILLRSTSNDQPAPPTATDSDIDGMLDSRSTRSS
jgi:hypothetical protein